jgi:hypothetical protein
MFTVKTDGETGLRYVTEDELTKNHRETDKELISGVMPASPGKAKHKKRCVFTVTSLKQFGLVGWKFSRFRPCLIDSKDVALYLCPSGLRMSTYK